MPEPGAGPVGRDPQVRILHFADLVNRHDFIDVIVRNADARRFALSVATLGRPSNIADPDYRSTAISHWNLAASSRSRYPLAVIRLAKLLRRERIDILHVHHFDPSIIALVSSILAPRTALLVGRHYSDAVYLHSTGVKRFLLLALEAALHHRARAVVAPSQMIRDLLISQHVDEESVFTIPYAFEEEKFLAAPEQVREVRAEFDGRPTVGVFARLYSDKGHIHLLRALPKVVSLHPQVLVVLLGEGDEEERLKAEVDRLHLSGHVRFLGFRGDALVVMSAVDIVVQPTVQEAFSQAMVEAAWLGKPLIISDVSGVRDTFVDGSTAIIVRPKDSDGLAAALIDLLTDEDRRTSLGRAAASSVRWNLSVRAILPRMEAVYQAVIDESAQGTGRRRRRTRRDRTFPTHRAPS